MATKKMVKKPIMKKGGTKDCTKRDCPREYYWRQDLCKCVKLLSMEGIKHPPSENDVMIKNAIQSVKNNFNNMAGVMRGETKPLTNTVKSASEGASNIASKALLNAAKELAKKKSKMGGSTYKTGGMVNANAKLQAAKSAGSKGVKSGVNPKAAASKVAKGRVGGTSAAPKTATPKAKYGMSITKMKKK